MSHLYEREQTVAAGAVRQAAQLCRGVRAEKDPATVTKSDLSPVTVADYGSQALICAALAEAFPNDPVMAEEDARELRAPERATVLDAVVGHVASRRPGAGRDEVLGWIDRGGLDAAAGRFWTVDPIDGTKGFLRGQQYAVALALIVDGSVQVAALACPNMSLVDGSRGTVYVAVRGQGAVAEAIDGDGGETRLRVSDRRAPADARLCESVESAHSSHGGSATVASRLGISAPAVRLDSQAKYAAVASAQADLYLRLPTRADYREKVWDHAAGWLIVTEAGGTVTDVDGRPLDFRCGRELSLNRGVVASNGHLHQSVVEALAAGH